MFVLWVTPQACKTRCIKLCFFHFRLAPVYSALIRPFYSEVRRHIRKDVLDKAC